MFKKQSLFVAGGVIKTLPVFIITIIAATIIAAIV